MAIARYILASVSGPIPLDTEIEDLRRQLSALPAIVTGIVELRTAVDEVRKILTGRRKDHYTVEEVAELTGRTPYTVRRWHSEGRVEAIRVSGTGPKGRLLISREEVQKLIGAGLGGNVPPGAAD